MLDESIFHVRGVGSTLSLSFYFPWKLYHVSNSVNPDQTPHNVASDRGLHCLPMTLENGFSASNVAMVSQKLRMDYTGLGVVSSACSIIIMSISVSVCSQNLRTRSVCIQQTGRILNRLTIL